MTRVLALSPVFSRRDLKHHALVVPAALVGCAKDIPLLVDSQAAIRNATVVAARKVVEIGKFPIAFYPR